MTRLCSHVAAGIALAGVPVLLLCGSTSTASAARRPGASVQAERSPATATAQDDAALREVVRLYVNAREARDPVAIGALFTGDVDQLVSSGEWRRGRDVLVKGTLASSAQTGGTRSITVETVRMLGPGVALVDGRYEISGLAGGAVRRMWSSFVMVRQDGAWRISAIRNMAPTTPAAGQVPVAR